MLILTRVGKKDLASRSELACLKQWSVKQRIYKQRFRELRSCPAVQPISHYKCHKRTGNGSSFSLTLQTNSCESCLQILLYAICEGAKRTATWVYKILNKLCTCKSVPLPPPSSSLRSSSQSTLYQFGAEVAQSVQWIGYGAGRPGFDSRQGRLRDFHSSSPHPDRLWGPPNLLSNGYRGSYPDGKDSFA
jgi:hypothetical protein